MTSAPADGATPADGSKPPVSSTAERAAALDAVAETRPPFLVIADFDGTLALGSRDSTVARIEPAAQRALRALVRLGPGLVVVAVLTGRTVRDVAERVRVGGVAYLGDHGLQHAALPRHGRVAALRPVSDPGWDGFRRDAERLAAAVPDLLGRPAWLYVEPKGPSVAFHVRQADDVAAARAAVLDAIGTVERRDNLDHGLVHYRGRSVVDLRPARAGGKREAVERLLAEHDPGAIIALGDESSDVDVFEAVRAGEGRSGGLRTLTVAVHGAGKAAPPELVARSDLCLASAVEVGPLLAGLARRLVMRERSR